MDKTTQDLAWRVLPKEFKEEVKDIFRKCLGVPKYKAITIKPMLLEDLFGIHNLTSDAEEEEMLTVKRSDVINEFDKLHKLSYIAADLQLGLNALTALFGSKCLLDAREDNFAKSEPKDEAT